MVLVVKSTLKPASFHGIGSEVDFEADFISWYWAVRSTSFHGIGGEVDFISWYLGLHFMVWCMLHLFNYKPVIIRNKIPAFNTQLTSCVLYATLLRIICNIVAYITQLVRIKRSLLYADVVARFKTGFIKTNLKLFHAH